MNACSFCQAVERRFIAVLLCLDELGNVLLGPSKYAPLAGNPHATISQRLAEMRSEGRRVGRIGCAVLTWIQNRVFNVAGDHCDEAMQGFPEDLPTDG